MNLVRKKEIRPDGLVQYIYVVTHDDGRVYYDATFDDTLLDEKVLSAAKKKWGIK